MATKLDGVGCRIGRATKKKNFFAASHIDAIERIMGPGWDWPDLDQTLINGI